MAVSHKVSFGGINLLGVNDYMLSLPSFGPVDFQTMRRHPFGIKGELELRGALGGQTIAIAVRMNRPTHSALRKAVNDIAFFKQGKHDKLSYQTSGTAAADKVDVGQVTFDLVQETVPIHRVLFRTDTNRDGYECDLLFIFRKLAQDE